jgi:hypothetical protein
MDFSIRALADLQLGVAHGLRTASPLPAVLCCSPGPLGDKYGPQRGCFLTARIVV